MKLIRWNRSRFPTRAKNCRVAAGVIATLLGAADASAARAEVAELRMMNSYGIAFLPVILMEQNRLVEHQAQLAGLGDLKVSWVTGGTGSNANDALLSGSVDVAATGNTAMITLWDKTHGTFDVRGISAMTAVPFELVTRNPAVRTVKDFTETDRIALPGVLISPQAVLLQMAAEQAFGPSRHAQLDPLTVTLTNPDGLTAMLAGAGGITAHFTTPPFQYVELRNPAIHKVIDSTDILGGPSTINLLFTTARFHDRNPRTYAAVLAAVGEAVRFIQQDRRAAAEIYLAATNDKKTPLADIVEILEKPEIQFTTVPQNVMAFATFMHRIGRVKQVAQSWKDLFFPEIHDQPGS